MTKKINVHGTAVRAGLSLNGILYTPEELAKFAPTLVDKPFLKDHINLTDNTIGLVTNSLFENTTTNVKYSGWIKDDGKGTIERIDDGRIKEVSIGGVVGRLVKEKLEDDFFIAKDMKAMELSTTPTPAVVGTSIKQTLKDLSEVKKPEDYSKVKPFSENVALINENYTHVINESKKVDESKHKVTIKDMDTEEEVTIKVISKFMCPLCETDLPSIEDLRKHMKEHNEEQSEEEKENKKNELEANKMAEDKTKVDEQLKALEKREAELKAKEDAVSTKEKAVKEKEDAFAKEERTKLESKYTDLTTEKNVEAQDISKKSNEVVEALVEQLRAIEVKEDEPAKEEPTKEPAKEEPAKEEPKDETKGKVSNDGKETLDLEDYKVEKSEFGKGYGIYKESYDPKKYNRLGR